jgi:hypothetical protein
MRSLDHPRDRRSDDSDTHTATAAEDAHTATAADASKLVERNRCHPELVEGRRS